MTEKGKHRRDVWESFWSGRPIEEIYPTSERILQQILSLGPPAGKWIMEIGAGSGRDGLRLAKSGGRVIFLDYAQSSLKLIAESAKKENASVYLVRADAFHLPFRQGCLDLVYHQGLLEHFERPEGIVAEIYYVLKSGGCTIADVPQTFHPYTLVKHVLIAMNKWFAGWETEFTAGQLRRLHEKCGLVTLRIYGDWMRPSFFYRAVREILKKIGIFLPMYPPKIPLLHRLRQTFRNSFRRLPAARMTFMDIGIVARKP
ncbi:MAG: class I SAM-dependent methyltransferase [candidate division KSB1 bacterium]|nr:class I SAM-dependent methyltransferase [candidate division KSB1 bacterium]